MPNIKLTAMKEKLEGLLRGGSYQEALQLAQSLSKCQWTAAEASFATHLNAWVLHVCGVRTRRRDYLKHAEMLMLRELERYPGDKSAARRMERIWESTENLVDPDLTPELSSVEERELTRLRRLIVPREFPHKWPSAREPHETVTKAGHGPLPPPKKVKVNPFGPFWIQPDGTVTRERDG